MIFSYFNAAIFALSIQCALAFAPAKIVPAYSPHSALSVASTNTAYSLDEYLLSKKGPIKEALSASVESRITLINKICEVMGY